LAKRRLPMRNRFFGSHAAATRRIAHGSVYFQSTRTRRRRAAEVMRAFGAMGIDTAPEYAWFSTRQRQFDSELARRAANPRVV